MRREVTREDFDQVYEIYMDETVNPYVNFEIMSKEAFRPIFDEMIAGGGFQVYEFEGEVVSALVVRCFKHRLKHLAYIGAFGIKQSFQGQGMGKKIMHLVQSAQDLKPIYLSSDLGPGDMAYIIRDIQWMFFVNEPINRSADFSQRKNQSFRHGNVTVTDTPDDTHRFLRTRQISGSGIDIVISYDEYERFDSSWYPRKINLKNSRVGYDIQVYVNDYRELSGNGLDIDG